MSGNDGRVAVQTYVSADQRELWREEADGLDMSQAEYVRSMVQAGRRSFDLYTDTDTLSSDPSNLVETGFADATPGDDDLKDRVLEILRNEEVADWDRLLSGVTDDVEERLEDALSELQSADRIRHSPRADGYTVIDDGR